MQLRPYQQEARKAIQKEWQEGKKRTLLVLPTGCGKTIVFSKVIEDRVRMGERVLVLAHRGELLDQASDKLEKSTGLKTAVEKAEKTSLGSFFRVVVGSIQSMQREKRLSQFPPNYFDTIIIDEAHHCISDGYQRVLSHFEDSNVLGVTATPDRGDMRNLGTYFESLAYEYTLPAAIKEGFLSPIKALTIPLKLDLTAVKQQAGDFSSRDLGTALDPYLYQIADELVKHCSNRKTVVFLPLVKTSKKFRDILNERGFRAGEVNGDSKDRVEVLEDFENDKYNVLCNSMLLTEGWDCPSVDCIVVLRPTKVRSLYSQMVGRGTRLHEGKEELLLLDFLWHTERHELCHPAHLIASSDTVELTNGTLLNTLTMDILKQTGPRINDYDPNVPFETSLIKEGVNVVFQNDQGEDICLFVRALETEDETTRPLSCVDIGTELRNGSATVFDSNNEQYIEYYVERELYDTGWEIGVNEISRDIKRLVDTSSDETPLARLQRVCEAFGCEMKFTVDFQNTKVKRKLVNIYCKIGADKSDKVLYSGVDVISLQKSVDIDNVITALEDTNHGFDDISIGDGRFFTMVGQSIVYDRESNALYGRGNTFNERFSGFITGKFASSNTAQIDNYNEAVSILEERCQPTFAAEVDMLFNDGDFEIGDWLTFVDEDYNPALRLKARVLSKEIHRSNPSENKAVVGNYQLLEK